MTFNELLTEVYQLTGRPDLIAETKSAVKAATLKAHKSDYYANDLYETGVSFDECLYIQCLDYNCLVPRFRTLKYLRRVQDANDTAGTFFTIVTPEEILDAYNCSRTDIAYVAGRSLEIRAAVGFQYAILGCYRLPDVTEEGYSSWIADQHSHAIIYEACRVLFKTIGFDEQSAAYNQLVAEEYNLLKLSGLTDVGY